MANIVLDRTLVSDLSDLYSVGPEIDLFGVEVELEGRRIISNREAIIKYWCLHQDGSLRITKENAQACEYVFRRPLNMEATQLALKILFDYLREGGVEVFESYRTSIHVHVNFLNDSFRTIVNFLTLAIIFDELFVSQNGDTRIGNNFCLRSKDAEGQITNLISSIVKHGSIFNLELNNRYSSINMSSLLKFGTVEFRSLECTTDYARVIHWIKTLQTLKDSAKQYENPREIISKFSRRGPLGFMISNLGDQAEKYIRVSDAHRMLHNGMRLAQDFAFCSDWQPPTKAEEKKLSARLKAFKPAEEHHWGNLNHVVQPGLMPNVPAPVPLAVNPNLNWINYVNQVALNN